MRGNIIELMEDTIIMQNIDNVYKTELNFVEEFNLSSKGMIKEIETEFDIIRLCFQELNELDEKYQTMFNRILVMPLRKLLCERGSVLLKLCPSLTYRIFYYA